MCHWVRGVENWMGFALQVKGATRFNQGTAGIVCFIQVNLFEVREIQTNANSPRNQKVSFMILTLVLPPDSQNPQDFTSEGGITCNVNLLGCTIGDGVQAPAKKLSLSGVYPPFTSVKSTGCHSSGVDIMQNFASKIHRWPLQVPLCAANT